MPRVGEMVVSCAARRRCPLVGIYNEVWEPQRGAAIAVWAVGPRPPALPHPAQTGGHRT